MSKTVYLSLIICALFITCFPNKKVDIDEPSALKTKNQIDTPTKIFLYNASVVLYPEGFQIQNGILKGAGEICLLNGTTNKLNSISVPIDSVAALTYYRFESRGGSILGSVLLGLYGGILTPLSIYCLACPKCCFGSCPTIYVDNGRTYELESELFSYCISRYFQESDLDKISLINFPEKSYRVRISNEALETHYIDQFSLMEVNHPMGTQMFPTCDGDFVCTRNLIVPLKVSNRFGEDVTDLVSKRDNIVYRSGDEMVKRISDGLTMDKLDIQLNLTSNTKKIKLVFRVRNTLMTTILFYDLVLSSQGVEAIEWTENMQNNYIYAKIFNELYKSYAGFRIKTFQEGSWKLQEITGDFGPIAWKEFAVELPVEAEHDSAHIRLEFFPDNFMIDYIGYDPSSDLNLSYNVNFRQPTNIVDDQRHSKPDLREVLKRPDGQYLITNPGESYYLSYNLLSNDSVNTSVFIKSKGYYIEWIRGNWLANHSDNYKFNLFEVDKTLNQLQKSWLINRPVIENKFFETRIPLKEDL